MKVETAFLIFSAMFLGGTIGLTICKAMGY